MTCQPLDLVDLMALRHAETMTESKPKVGATDARRAASAAYHKKRAEAGMKKVTVWLSPEAQDALERLKEVYGSKDKAVDTLIIQASKG